MNNKRVSRALSLVLLCALLSGLCAPSIAAGDSETVYLTSADSLRAFAEQCSYDAWSEGKTVVLQRDIALGGVDFLPIASFGGTFEGNGHTISGLNISASISPAGLFGTIAESGIVRDLTVEGSVAPGGSADIVGGIAGVNRGMLVGCSFVGTVDGEKRTGGIAGENATSGTIRRCDASGGVFGKNMTGGIVGANHGTVSLCVNRAYVNTNTIDPSVTFDKLDLSMTNGLDSLMSPDVYNVTVDSGGVAGFSDGSLLGCHNYGSVGYQHIGYNVGGVAGRSSGHVSSCENDGRIYGRREVGGVIGMAEPYVKLNIKESSIERVRRELNTLGSLIDKTVSDAESGAQTVSERLSAINDSVDEAENSAKALTDRLSDYWDGTVEEINRGSDIVDVVIPQLHDIADELTGTSDTASEALDLLEKAIGEAVLPDGINGAAFAELSSMAGDLRTAVQILNAGTKQVESGLATLDKTISPKEGLTEDEWRDLVYGKAGADGKRSGGALDEARDGLHQATDGMSDLSAVLSELSTAIEDEAKDADIGTPEKAALFLGHLMTDFLPKFFEDHPIDEALKDVSDGLAKTNEALKTIEDNTEVQPQNISDGLSGVRAGLRTMTDGRGGDKGGAFDYISDALGHLQSASSDASHDMNELQNDVNAVERPKNDLQAAIGRLRDASNGMTGALGKTEKMLDYLRNQEKLNFETLGEETDASADALYDAMHDISNHIELLNQEAKASSDAVLEDVRQINRQFTVMMNTLLDVVEETEGVSASSVVEDTSDEDLESVMQGKVLLCGNAGEVSGDIDVGGVAGAMMVYNELDPENDDDTLSSAFHKSYELKCILQDCTNSGTVTGKRDNVGAICGSATLGAISGCEAYGAVKSEGGDCVGGIAGYGDNTVRKCWSRCTLAGAQNVGGVVGGGRAERSNLRVADCRALVEVTESTQYAGAILGADAGELSGNLFVSDTLAGIDRVSVRGKAEPVSYEELLAQEGLPQAFRRFTLKFVANDETIRAVDFNYGDSFDASSFPEIPAIEGQFARWDRTELDDLRFDTTVTAVYEPCVTALASDLTRSAARATFFVEGAFDDAAMIDASPAIYDFSDGQTDFWSRLRSYRKTLLEQWQLTIPDDGAAAHTVRYLPPEGVSDHIELYALEDGAWRKLDTGKMGSYLTFETDADEVELTVISTATPWWVWALVGGFVLVALVLLAVLLIRKKPKRELTDEEKLKEAKRKKRRKTVRVILIAAALALGIAAGSVLMLAPGLTDSMGLYMLLRNYAERTDHDMDLSVTAHVNEKTFDADVGFFTTLCGEKRVSCVMWEDIPLYYCDGVMLLENGRAYRAEGVLPDYSKLLSHVAGLYRAVEVTASEENGVKTYHAVARGEAAEQLLALLLNENTPVVPETETVQMDLLLTDGEPTNLHIEWNGVGGDVKAELRHALEERDHTLPQAVRSAIESGEYTKAEEVGEQVGRFILTWTELATRDPLDADVSLTANCGPLLLDEKLTWQRTQWNGTRLSCVSHRGARIYYTDDAACTGNGLAVDRGSAAFTDAGKLLHLAYEAFLLGEAEYTETTNGCRYAITLDEAGMLDFAGAIAPETKTLGISFSEGTVRLDVRDGAASSISVQCKGRLRVVRTDVPASVSAYMEFGQDKPFLAPAQKTLSALGLEARN